MKKNQYYIIPFLCLAIGLLGAVQDSYARKKKTVRQETKVVADEPSLPYNDKLRYDYFFIEAAKLQNAGDYASAFELLEHARHINPLSAEVYFMESMYHSEMKNDSLAVKYLEKATQLSPDNLTYLERLSQNYIATQDYDKAINSYELLASKRHKDNEPLNVLLQLYQFKKDYPKMISTLDRLEVQEGNSEQLTLNKMHVYELMGDKKSSYQVLKNLSDSHPLDLNYKTMLGNWLMQNERQEEAYKLYTAVLNEEPDNNYALSSLYDYYNATNQTEKANELLTKLLIMEKTPISMKATLMRSFISSNESHGGDSTQVLALFDKILAEKQANADMAELKAAYMSLKKMPEDSLLNAFNAVLDIAPDNANARLEIIQTLWRKQDYKGVIDMCKPAMQYNPEEMVFYYFSGMAHFQIKDNDKALEDFRRGVGQINSKSNADIVSDFYAIMGDILHEKGMKEEAFAAYDSCLQWKDDNISCLNNYAYYMSLEGTDLAKAESMSHKTIVAEPKNPTFLDTYAWILFNEERYAEAKIYIDQTLANMDSTLDNTAILEHAGDIYSMVGLTDEAVKYWKQALEKKADNAVLPKKIKQRKYIKQ